MNSVSLPLINFRKFTKTGEKWVLYDNPKKRKSWIDPGQPSTAKLNIHAKKFLVKVKAPNQFAHLINLLFYYFFIYWNIASYLVSLLYVYQIVRLLLEHETHLSIFGQNLILLNSYEYNNGSE